tara:strand:- start:3603 stop:3911 length:309 start_codon:yes stop_codon:yes gene_type:complete
VKGGKMQEIKKLGVLSVAKISALLGIFFGLILGVILAVVSKFAGGALPELTGVAFSWGSLFFLPVFYGVTYFIGGLVMAALYNLCSGWVGGIKVDLSKGDKK